jgi:hypothetical protein
MLLASAFVIPYKEHVGEDREGEMGSDSTDKYSASIEMLEPY